MEELLQTLCQIPALSGDEAEIRQYIKQLFNPWCVESISDRLGSFFLKKEGECNDYRVMLSTNMDESGGIINDINEQGLLSFLVVGHYSKDDFKQQHVIVLTRKHDRVYGIVVEHEGELMIDVGACSKEELIQKHVQIGDTMVISTQFRQNKDSIFSNNLNNRACLAVEKRVLDLLDNKKVQFTTFIGAISHSVTGYRGAITATHAIQPDMAIILDASYVKDCPSNAICIRYFDKTMLPNQQLIKQCSELAQSLGFELVRQVQEEGSDAAFIHKSLKGTPSIVVTLPLRHQKGLLNRVCLKDMEHLAQFIVAFLTQLSVHHIQECLFEE